MFERGIAIWGNNHFYRIDKGDCMARSKSMGLRGHSCLVLLFKLKGSERKEFVQTMAVGCEIRAV